MKKGKEGGEREKRREKKRGNKISYSKIGERESELKIKKKFLHIPPEEIIRFVPSTGKISFQVIAGGIFVLGVIS